MEFKQNSVILRRLCKLCNKKADFCGEKIIKMHIDKQRKNEYNVYNNSINALTGTGNNGGWL